MIAIGVKICRGGEVALVWPCECGRHDMSLAGAPQAMRAIAAKIVDACDRAETLSPIERSAAVHEPGTA